MQRKARSPRMIATRRVGQHHVWSCGQLGESSAQRGTFA
jgi:hypothetical protein